MSTEIIRNVAVIGAGLMGNRIAEVFLINGFTLFMVDIQSNIIDQGIAAIESRLDRYQVSAGKITVAEKKSLMQNLHGSTDFITSVKEVDFLLESVSENMDLKKEVFRQADRTAKPDVILATNTSYLSITELGAATSRPDKVVGMHFFYPPAISKLIEIPYGSRTSAKTVNTVRELAFKLGKEPVICNGTSFGFLANRAYYPLRQEAIQMVWENVASPGEIDKALKLGYNLPIGPLEQGDLIGSWGIYTISESDRIRELGAVRGQLHPLIREMVRAGYPGGPGKKGIYAFWEEVLSKK